MLTKKTQRKIKKTLDIGSIDTETMHILSQDSDFLEVFKMFLKTNSNKEIFRDILHSSLLKTYDEKVPHTSYPYNQEWNTTWMKDTGVDPKKLVQSFERTYDLQTKEHDTLSSQQETEKKVQHHVTIAQNKMNTLHDLLASDAVGATLEEAGISLTQADKDSLLTTLSHNYTTEKPGTLLNTFDTLLKKHQTVLRAIDPNKAEGS
mgnify:CR=1 FL=1